jgi:hypothetical protein
MPLSKNSSGRHHDTTDNRLGVNVRLDVLLFDKVHLFFIF